VAVKLYLSIGRKKKKKKQKHSMEPDSSKEVLKRVSRSTNQKRELVLDNSVFPP